jgi:hypothetical protein
MSVVVAGRRRALLVWAFEIEPGSAPKRTAIANVSIVV